MENGEQRNNGRVVAKTQGGNLVGGLASNNILGTLYDITKQSLGILVDMLGVLLGKIAKIEEIEPAEENNVQ